MYYRIKKNYYCLNFARQAEFTNKTPDTFRQRFLFTKNFQSSKHALELFLLQKSCAKCKNTNFPRRQKRVVAVQIGNTLAGGVFMICFGCNREIDNNDYCICTKCRKTMCPQCAAKNSFVCSQCGGDIAYLS